MGKVKITLKGASKDTERIYEFFRCHVKTISDSTLLHDYSIEFEVTVK